MIVSKISKGLPQNYHPYIGMMLMWTLPIEESTEKTAKRGVCRKLGSKNPPYTYIGIIPIEMIGMWIVHMWILCQKLGSKNPFLGSKNPRLGSKNPQLGSKNPVQFYNPLKRLCFLWGCFSYTIYTVIDSIRRGRAHLCERWLCPLFPLGKRELFSSRGRYQEGGTR